jgi:hypothetical protein
MFVLGDLARALTALRTAGLATTFEHRVVRGIRVLHFEVPSAPPEKFAVLGTVQAPPTARAFDWLVSNYADRLGVRVDRHVVASRAARVIVILASNGAIPEGLGRRLTNAVATFPAVRS